MIRPLWLLLSRRDSRCFGAGSFWSCGPTLSEIPWPRSRLIRNEDAVGASAPSIAARFYIQSAQACCWPSDPLFSVHVIVLKRASCVSTRRRKHNLMCARRLIIAANLISTFQYCHPTAHPLEPAFSTCGTREGATICTRLEASKAEAPDRQEIGKMPCNYGCGRLNSRRVSDLHGVLVLGLAGRFL